MLQFINVIGHESWNLYIVSAIFGHVVSLSLFGQ